MTLVRLLIFLMEVFILNSSFGFISVKDGTTNLVASNQTNLKTSKQEEQRIMSQMKQYGHLFSQLSSMYVQWNDVHELNLDINSVIAGYDDFEDTSNYLLSEEKQLGEQIGRYCLKFLELVASNERLAKAYHKANEFTSIKHQQYDKDIYYAVAYGTGIYTKHQSKFIPLNSKSDENGTQYSISLTQINKTTNLSPSTAKIFKQTKTADLINTLDHVEIILLNQMNILIQILLQDHPIDDFMKIVQQYLEPYGLPIFMQIKDSPSGTNQHSITISASYDYQNFNNEEINTFQLTNMLGITKIKILDHT